jgi:hypothetical protein
MSVLYSNGDNTGAKDTGMSDARLAQILVAVTAIESAVRVELAATDAEERDAALVAVRQAIALRKPLERWIAARAIRAAQ